MVKKLIPYLFYLIYLIAGALTVKIVVHWDELKLVEGVIQQYSNHHFLPTWYNYPSVIFYISYTDYWLWDILFHKWIPDFNHFNRFIFFALTGIPFFYLFRLSREYGASILSASLVACTFFVSWEFHYHSRWVAPDALMSAFGFISLFYCISSRHKHLVLATVFAGLAAGTKYTGAIFLLPILITFSTKDLRKSVKSYLLVLGIFILTFILTTPGVLFEFGKVVKDISFERQHYATGHYNSTVASGWPHLKLLLNYVLIIPNKFIIPLILFWGLTVIGIFKIIVSKKYKTLVLILAPIILYLIYLSTQKVMFARNYLLIWPVLCYFAANGVIFLKTNVNKTYGIILVFTVFSSLVLGNVLSDWSIIKHDQGKQYSSLMSYLRSNPKFCFNISAKLSDGIKEHDPTYKPACSDPSNPEKQYAVFYLTELKQEDLHTNYRWIKEQIGPDDVNLNYYPTFQTNHRIVIAKLDYLKDVDYIDFIEF